MLLSQQACRVLLRRTQLRRCHTRIAPLSRRSFSTRPSTVDDDALVPYFDKPSFSGSYGTHQPTGLFQDSRLSTPDAFKVVANQTIINAESLVQRIVSSPSSRPEMFKVVKYLDRLSDTLCSIIDLAELVRNVHPEESWIQSAHEAYESLCEYMNVLNTHTGLDETLRLVLADEEIVKSLSDEAFQTAKIFARDFERSGIHLPDFQRSRFVALSSEILSLGRTFLSNSSTPRHSVTLSVNDLEGFERRGRRFINHSLRVQPGSAQAHAIMQSAPQEAARMKVYIAANSSTQEELDVLDRLLKARGELASLVGYPSYAAMTLDDKMAGTPENVNEFLVSLASHMRPSALQAIETIRQRKHAHLGDTAALIVQPWDREYYLPSVPPRPVVDIPPASIGTTFRALSRLFTHIYGICLRPATINVGEVWSQDVRKLEVVDEDKGVLGWIYTDLFARPGKPSGAAHYTVQCSRSLDEEGYVEPSIEINSRVGYGIHSGGHVWQLPVVVLTCEFGSSSWSQTRSSLEWHEIQTLYHEMGHAIHSMIGRTEYHNVSGTRCATDFVEFPSILMEHFLTSPAVLSLLGPDNSLFQSTQPRTVYPSEVSSTDAYYQIVLALLDQSYHSPHSLDNDFSSTRTLINVQQAYGIFPYVAGTTWQTQFGHLFGYGATYYSYLFDRTIAHRVWQKLFSQHALDRDRGEKLKSQVLKWGGGKNPWDMVGSVLDEPRLTDGGVEAMREVGRWRVDAGVASQGMHL